MTWNPLKFVGIQFDGKTIGSKTRSGKEWKVEYKGINTEIPDHLINDSNPYRKNKPGGKVRILDNGWKYLEVLFSKL